MDETRYQRRMKILQEQVDAKKAATGPSNGLTTPSEAEKWTAKRAEEQKHRLGDFADTQPGDGIPLCNTDPPERQAKDLRQMSEEQLAVYMDDLALPYNPQSTDAELMSIMKGAKQQMDEVSGIDIRTRHEQRKALLAAWPLSHFTRLNTHENEQPPIGLRPRHIADAARKQEILDAIERHKAAGGKMIPHEWALELAELEAGENLRQFVGQGELIAIRNRRGKSVAPFLMARALDVLRGSHRLQGMEIDFVWYEEAAMLAGPFDNYKRVRERILNRELAALESAHPNSQERTMDTMKTGDEDENEDETVIGPTAAKAMPDMEMTGENEAAGRGVVDTVTCTEDQGAKDNMAGKL